MVSKDAKIILTHLCTVYVGYEATVPTKIAKELLLFNDATTMREGHLLSINAKSIGAGVYKVWLSKQESTAIEERA